LKNVTNETIILSLNQPCCYDNALWLWKRGWFRVAKQAG